MNRVKDVFDKRMDRPVWEKVWPLYDKHREFVLYSFFGMGTFLVSVCTYYFFTQTLGLNALVANVYSWMFAVLFAFLTNRVWVFQAPTQTWGEFVKQAVGFWKIFYITGRGSDSGCVSGRQTLQSDGCEALSADCCDHFELHIQ